MDSIVPCRSCVSERFPIASFAIRAPQPRFFEVVCATDPRLLHTDHARARTLSNFYSSRADGLLFAERGDATWIVPPRALQRFAGARKLFYALGTYAGRRGEDPRFSISPNALERVPSIGIAADFTGRSLDRRRIGAAAPSRSSQVAYGGAAGGVPLRWGGDAVLEAERLREQSRSRVAIGGYDDGVDDSSTAVDAYDPDYASDMDVGATVDAAVGMNWAVAAGESVEATPSANVEDGPEYEDAAELYAREHGPAAQALGSHRATRMGYAGDDDEDDDFDADADDADDRYGSRAARRPAARKPAAAHRVARYRRAQALTDSPARGRHPAYREEDVEESLAIGPAAHALSARGLDLVPLEISEKVRIVRVVARAESAADGYSAIAADPEYEDPAHPAYRSYHIGLSWGLIQFTQRGGALGHVLRLAKAREVALASPAAEGGGLAETETFASLFGPAWQSLLTTTDPATTPDADGRVAPVDGAVLWEEPWVTRFRNAGQIGYVQAAQNEVAVVDYFDPILPIARGLGLVTARGLALLLDRAVHMGVGGARTWIMRAAGVIRSESDRDVALSALGFAGDLTGFQRARGLVVDGKWGPQSHAAIMQALRELGSAAPVAIPAAAQTLSQLMAAAAASDFAARMQALFDNRADFDDSITFAV